MGAIDTGLALAERGLLPDRLLRLGIRQFLGERLVEVSADRAEDIAARQNLFVEAMGRSVIAPATEMANQQHYDVPADFYAHVLGSRLKYSCCYWPTEDATLDDAEVAALRLTCERARIADGMTILDVGCGWGSLSLWMAEHYPASTILAVSNSASQRAFVEGEMARRGIRNVTVVTADMNHFDPGRRFDRIVSLEMFEHMRNYRELFGRVARWLAPGGLFFLHIFCHREAAYLFESKDPNDWMSRHFFTGGMMPSDDLPLRFQDDVRLVERWRWDGRHYQRTAEAWLARMDQGKGAILPILARTYGEADAQMWWGRWRMFFMACAEMFAFNRGQEWWVSHYLFESRGPA